MTEPRPDDSAQARREACQLLGLDADNLSPADTLRCDLVSSLRLCVDAERAAVLSGNSADLGKLNVAVASLIALLPGRELPEPKPADGGPSDPRRIMWETYKRMRDRGAAFGEGLDGAHKRIAELEAELAALKAGAPASSTTPPLPDNVVPLARPTTTERSVAATPPKPAQPQGNMVDLRAGYSDGPAEPWRDFCVGGRRDPWADNRT
jgi:hypothetical protein